MTSYSTPYNITLGKYSHSVIDIMDNFTIAVGFFNSNTLKILKFNSDYSEIATLSTKILKDTILFRHSPQDNSFLSIRTNNNEIYYVTVANDLQSNTATLISNPLTQNDLIRGFCSSTSDYCYIISWGNSQK